MGVGMLADLIRRPHFEARHLALEKKVVLQELAEANDTPSDLVFDLLQEVAYPDQPLGRPVLGDKDTIGNITVDDLSGWLRTQYPASSLLLVAAGKLDHDRLVDCAEAAFGTMAAGTRAVAAPALFGGGVKSEALRGAQAHIALAMPAPAWGADGHHAAHLFADVVGGGASSQLFQRLREDQGLAYSVSAATAPYADAGMFYAYAAVDKGDAQHARAEVEAVLADAARNLTQRDLERARAMAKAGMMMSLESCWGQASYLATRLIREGHFVEPHVIVERLDAVTLDAVRTAGQHMLSGPRALASVGARLELAA
jgi:predicted Zn-dependent peptidase